MLISKMVWGLVFFNSLFLQIIASNNSYGQTLKLGMPTGYEGDYDIVRYSPNGNLIAAGMERGLVRVWDVETGRLIHENNDIYCHKLITMMFNKSSTELFVSTDDYFIHRINLIDGNFLKKKCSRMFYSLDINDESGNLLLVTYHSGRFITVEYDINTGRIIREFNDAPLSTQASLMSGGFSDYYGYRLGKFSHFSPDFKHFVSAINDSIASIFDFSTGRKSVTLESCGKYILNGTFSPDGKKILLNYFDRSYSIHDALTGKMIRTGNGLENTEGFLRFTTLNTLIKVSKKTVFVAEEPAYEFDSILTFKNPKLCSSDLSPDGRSIVIARYREPLSINHMNDTVAYHTLTEPCVYTCFLSELSDCHSMLVSTIDEKGFQIHGFDYMNGQPIPSLEKTYHARKEMMVSKKSRYLISYESGDSISIHELPSLRFIKNLCVFNKNTPFYEKNLAKYTCFDSDEKCIIFLNENKIISCEISSGKEKVLVSPESSTLISIKPNAKGDKIVAGTEDGSVHVYEISTGKRITSMKTDSLPVKAVAISADEKNIISISKERVGVYDMNSGKLVWCMKEYRYDLERIEFSADGEFLILANHCYRMKNGDIVYSRFEKKGVGENFVFNRSREIMDISKNNDFYVEWDEAMLINTFSMKNGKSITEFKYLPRYTALGVLTQDEKYLITTGIDRKTYISEVKTGKLLYVRVQKNENDWLAYDSQGHYDGTTEAINELYLYKNSSTYPITTDLHVPGLVGKIMRNESLDSVTSLKKLESNYR